MSKTYHIIPPFSPMVELVKSTIVQLREYYIESPILPLYVSLFISVRPETFLLCKPNLEEMSGILYMLI